MYFIIVKVLKPHMLSGCEIGDNKYNTNHINPKMRAHEILNLQEKLSHLEKECRLVSVLSYLTEITHLTNSEARNPSTRPMTKSAGCVLVSFKDSVIRPWSTANCWSEVSDKTHTSMKWLKKNMFGVVLHLTSSRLNNETDRRTCYTTILWPLW